MPCLAQYPQESNQDASLHSRGENPDDEIPGGGMGDTHPQTHPGDQGPFPNTNSANTSRLFNALFMGSGTDRLELIILNFSTGEVVVLDSDAVPATGDGTNPQDIYLEGLGGLQDLFFSGDNTGSQYENFLRIAEILGPARPRSVPIEDINEELPIVIWRREDFDKDTIEDDVLANSVATPPEPELRDACGVETRDSSPEYMNDVLAALRVPPSSDPPQIPNQGEFVSTSEDPGSASASESPRRMRLRDMLGSNEKCSICLTNYEEGDQLRIIKCQHGFHKDCIDKWLVSYVNSCPICRNKAVTPRVRPENDLSREQPVNEPSANRSNDEDGNTGGSGRVGPGIFTWRIL